MSFDTLTFDRKKYFFKQALRAYESSLGVWVQKVPAAQVVRLFKDGDTSDPLYKALKSLDAHFPGCLAKDVDMAGCVESIVLEHAKNKQGDGAVCIAWAQEYPAAPKPVGLITLHNFVQSKNFHTTNAEIGDKDFDTLSRYFGSRYLYIDCMCSTKVGVGRLLLQHAMRHALMKKKTGVIALAFSMKASSTQPLEKPG